MKIRNLLIAMLAVSSTGSICSKNNAKSKKKVKPYSNLTGLSKRR